MNLFSVLSCIYNPYDQLMSQFILFTLLICYPLKKTHPKTKAKRACNINVAIRLYANEIHITHAKKIRLRGVKVNEVKNMGE